MTLLGSQDTGLGSVDTASGGAGDGGGGGDIEEITSTDGSVTITGPTGPITDLSVPAAQPPASAVTGLSFPIVAGTPTLSAVDPVVLPGLVATGGGVEVAAGNFVVDVGVPATIHGTLEVDGTTTMNGALDANNGVAVLNGETVQGGLEVVTGTFVADAGVPATIHDTLEVDGATTMNGALAANNGAAISGAGTINGQPIAAQIVATTVNGAGTPLSGISAAALTAGSTLAWVSSVGAYFRLQISALAVDHLTVETASGMAGAQWLRMDWRNPVWEAQTAWTVNTASGSDEAAGTGGAPLKTMSEAARRLSFAQLSATTITLIGSMATTDLPTWTVSGGVFCLSIVGTTTALFTGSVTTAVNVSAAPTTTENDLTDTSIPASFTASGLLANGVRVAFTSGAAGRSCWIAKDNGAKTARIAQPHTAFGGNATFANGDTYVAGQLPTVRQMHFVGMLTANGVFFQTVLFPTGYQLDEQCFYFNDCWFTSPAIANNVYENCAFQGGGGIDGAGDNTNGGAIFNGGMWRGSGTTQFLMYATPGIQTNDTLTLQGVWWNLQNGSFATFQGDFLSYDCTATTGPLSANYWSEILFSAGAVGGVNNTVLASVSRMGQIAHIPTPLWLAGSATSGTPILVAGTVGSPLTVAAETAGGGVVNTKQNGIYPTA